MKIKMFWGKLSFYFSNIPLNNVILLYIGNRRAFGLSNRICFKFRFLLSISSPDHVIYNRKHFFIFLVLPISILPFSIVNGRALLLESWSEVWVTKNRFFVPTLQDNGTIQAVTTAIKLMISFIVLKAISKITQSSRDIVVIRKYSVRGIINKACVGRHVINREHGKSHW